MAQIELVVFDLAGTTIDDTGNAVLEALNVAARTHSLAGTSNELNALMGMNKREVFGLLAGRTLPNATAAQQDTLADAALATFLAAMAAHYADHLAPLPGAEETFRFLRQRGIKIATDTGFDSTISSLIMCRLGWPGNLTDCAICSSDVPRGRPAPYMIFRAMQETGVIDVRRVLKIGDSPADLEEGMNAGCGEVIGVLSGAHTAVTLGRYPHTRLLSSVADLPALWQSGELS